MYDFSFHRNTNLKHMELCYLIVMHVKQWSNFEVDLTVLKTAKCGYLDCTRDILQIHVR